MDLSQTANSAPADPAAFAAEIRRGLAYLAALEPLRDALLAAEGNVDPGRPVAPATTNAPDAAPPAAIEDLKAEIWAREAVLAVARPLAADPAVKAALCARLQAAPAAGDLLPVLLPVLLALAGGAAPVVPRDAPVFAGILALVERAGAATYCAEAGA